MERQHGAFHEAHLRKRGPTAQPREQLEHNNGDDVYVDSGRCLALGTCRDDSRVTVHKSRLQGLSGFSMPQPGFMHSKPHPCHASATASEARTAYAGWPHHWTRRLKMSAMSPDLMETLYLFSIHCMSGVG